MRPTSLSLDKSILNFFFLKKKKKKEDKNDTKLKEFSDCDLNQVAQCTSRCRSIPLVTPMCVPAARVQTGKRLRHSSEEQPWRRRRRGLIQHFLVSIVTELLYFCMGKPTLQANNPPPSPVAQHAQKQGTQTGPALTNDATPSQQKGESQTRAGQAEQLLGGGGHRSTLDPLFRRQQPRDCCYLQAIDHEIVT